MKNNIWSISYKQDDKEICYDFYNKRSAVLEYLKIIETSCERDLSELKILKNGNDYTPTLNKFICK